MKKLLCVLWMLLMLGSLAACGSEKNTESGDLMDASASDPAASQAQSAEETPPEATSLNRRKVRVLLMLTLRN